MDADLMTRMPEILAAHAKWRRGEAGGARANLAGANLAGADLAGANLAGADLAGADLAGADLTGATLARAYLAGANLAGATLARAYLADANLAGADLADANLAGANLAGAYLADAYLTGVRGVDPPPFGPVTLPDWTFRAYKLCRGNDGERVIVTLEIPEDARRVAPLVGRKCRADKVKVIAMSVGTEAKSWHSPPAPAKRITYRVGETVAADVYDPSPFIECGGGIHFFISRREAEKYWA